MWDYNLGVLPLHAWIFPWGGHTVFTGIHSHWKQFFSHRGSNNSSLFPADRFIWTELMVKVWGRTFLLSNICTLTGPLPKWCVWLAAILEPQCPRSVLQTVALSFSSCWVGFRSLYIHSLSHSFSYLYMEGEVDWGYY